jgi:uncharacterized protein (DUF58 family)
MGDSPDRSLSSIFLTPFVLTFVGLLFFIALLNSQRDLTVLTLILLCIAALAGLWARWSLRGIACAIHLDNTRLFPEETLLVKITAENRKFLPVWLRAIIPISSGLWHGERGPSEVASEFGLLWHQQTDSRWELKALRRGVHRIGPLRISSGDLFGFYPRSREFPGIREVVVFPRLAPLQQIVLPPRDFFGIPGADTHAHDPVYILGTRDYQYGSPAKHIHWKASARHHKLQEKIFEPSGQEKILLAVDVSPFTGDAEAAAFEHMLEMAASAAVHLAGRGCSVGLITNGRITGEASPVVAIARCPNQPAVILETLARLQMETSCGILALLRRQLTATSGISCLYFSLADDNEPARTTRNYMQSRHVPFRFISCKRSEANLKIDVDGDQTGQEANRDVGGGRLVNA